AVVPATATEAAEDHEQEDDEGDPEQRDQRPPWAWAVPAVVGHERGGQHDELLEGNELLTLRASPDPGLGESAGGSLLTYAEGRSYDQPGRTSPDSYAITTSWARSRA